MSKENYFKGLKKSPNQLLKNLAKYLKEVNKNVEGYGDTCEYHLEQEKCKKTEDYASVQVICEEISLFIENAIDEIETNGLKAQFD